LARRPALLDSILEPRFATPLNQDVPGERTAELETRIAAADNFEAKLNAARRFHREEAFRIGVQVLESHANAEEAGRAYAELAEACVAAMAQAAVAEVERAHGPQPGAFTVLALGKFGGRELAEGSDLDLMVVYDAAEERAQTASDFYTRVTQRLISALSAPTEEGSLYEIDTKLRPSGSKGPVAVRLSSFGRYYEQEAWIWEMQALTRLRVVGGDPALGARAMAIALGALARPRDPEATLAEVANMRARMDRERASKSPWDLKLAPGGFVDIEFAAQGLQLIAAAETPSVVNANTGEALDALVDAGALAPDRGALLLGAWRAWSDLQQLIRICIEGEFSAASAPAPLLSKLAAMLNAPGASALEERLAALQAQVRAVFLQIVGSPRDGTPAPPR
jgi:glutamate-ammonia-ligase adenylyltransferase